jgi:hypothetical protein
MSSCDRNLNGLQHPQLCGDAQLQATVVCSCWCKAFCTLNDAMGITNGKTCQNFLQALKANADETAEEIEKFYIYKCILELNFATINGLGEPIC